jgi:hypothetical protein
MGAVMQYFGKYRSRLLRWRTVSIPYLVCAECGLPFGGEVRNEINKVGFDRFFLTGKVWPNKCRECSNERRDNNKTNSFASAACGMDQAVRSSSKYIYTQTTA